MNLDLVLLAVADGVSYAGLLFMVSLGLTLVCGVMGIVNVAFDKIGKSMQAMVNIPMTGDKPFEFFKAVLPLPDPTNEIEVERVRQKHNRLFELFETGIGNDLPGVRGSLWATYNAVTQWVDRESYTTRNKEPLKSIWFGDGAAIKHRAFEKASELVGIPA